MISLRVVLDLITSIKKFIGKTKDIKNINILQKFKFIKNKINK